MFEFIPTDNQKGTLTLTGQMTLQNIVELSSQFFTSLSSVNELFINHEKSDEFDIAYIQLLHSLIKTASLQNKKISFIGEQPEVFINRLKIAGDYLLLSKLVILLATEEK
jgi:ABC-type transporter Mla MlaB component